MMKKKKKELKKMNKKIPMRKCAGCGKSRPKQELIRIVATEDGVKMDPTGRANGRGVYICGDNKKCFELAKKKNAIARSIKKDVPQESIDALEKELKEYER